MRQILVLLTLFVSLVTSAFDIMHFGAIPNSDNIKDHFANQKAILAAIKAANEATIDRVIRIPNKTFYTMPFWL